MQYAALHAYADLTSHVVYEFPELQGYMGGEYAALEGKTQEAAAMRDFYLPLTSTSALPSTLEGNLVALAGKMDTLCGNFLIGQIPSGSEDPFALRRQAFAVVRILLEKGLNVSIKELVEASAKEYPQNTPDKGLAQLPGFLFQRLALVLEQRGHTPCVINAVTNWYEMPLPQVEALVSALEAVKNGEEFASVLEPAKRVCNILKKAGDVSETVSENLLDLPAEKELYNQIHQVDSSLGCRVNTAHSTEDYLAVLKTYASFKEPLERFFTDVMVNAPEPAVRNNRLALLARVRRYLTQTVADITKL